MPYLPAPEYNVGDIVRISPHAVGAFDWMTDSVRCEVTELYKGCCGSGYLVRVRNLDTKQLKEEYDSFFFEKETQTIKTPCYTNENRTMLPVQECEVEKLQIGDRFKNLTTGKQTYLIGNWRGNVGVMITEDAPSQIETSVTGNMYDSVWYNYSPIGKAAIRLRPLLPEPVKTWEEKLKELLTKRIGPNYGYTWEYLCADIERLAKSQTMRVLDELKSLYAESKLPMSKFIDVVCNTFVEVNRYAKLQTSVDYEAELLRAFGGDDEN